MPKRSGTGVLQKRSSEMVDLLSADFQARGEPNFSLQKIISMISLLPGAVGFWPLSTKRMLGGLGNPFGTDDYLGYWGLRLWPTAGGPTINLHGLISYMHFTAATKQYGVVGSSYNNSDIRITGTEILIEPSLRGLTLGAWVRISSTTGVDQPLMARWSTSMDDDSYALYWDDSESCFVFSISNTGNALDTYSVSSARMSYGTWYYVVGRFTPSMELKIRVNNDFWTNKTQIPVSIFFGYEPLWVGAGDMMVPYTDLLYLNGDMCIAFLTCTSLPDTHVRYIYEHTKCLFGY